MQEGRCQMTTQKGFQCLRQPHFGIYCSQHSTCSVCLGGIKNGNSRTLPCNHTFHSRCIDRWKQNSNTCPMCRVPFDQPQYKVNISVHHLASNLTVTDSYQTSNVQQLLDTFNLQSRYISDIFFDVGIDEFIEDVFREIGVRLPSRLIEIEREHSSQHQP